MQTQATAEFTGVEQESSSMTIRFSDLVGSSAMQRLSMDLLLQMVMAMLWPISEQQNYRLVGHQPQQQE